MAIHDLPTFRTGWIVLLLLLVGFFVLEPLGIPVSAIATTGALILFAVAKRGHAINTGKVLRGAPWQIVIFSLGMYLVVYGLRNAGLTESLSGVLDYLAGYGLWVTTLGTGFITAFLSSIMNNMPTVLIGALSIEGSAATGLVKEAMIYANVIGCDLGPKITPIGEPGYPAMASCAGTEKHDYYLGLLFQDGHHNDAASSLCDACRAGATSLLHTVMSNGYEPYHYLPQPGLRHVAQYAGDDPQQRYGTRNYSLS